MGRNSKTAKPAKASADPVTNIAMGVAGNKATDAIDWLRNVLAPGAIGSAGPLAPLFSQETWAFLAAVFVPLGAVCYITYRLLPVLRARSLAVHMAFLMVCYMIVGTTPVMVVLNRRDVEHRERIGYSAEKLPLFGDFASRGASNTDEQFRDLCLTAIEPTVRGKDRLSDDIRVELWVHDAPRQRLVAPNSNYLYNVTSDAAQRTFDVSPASKELGIAGKCFRSAKVENCPDARDERQGAKHFKDRADLALPPNVAILCAPVFAPGTRTVVGVLAITSTRQEVFKADDERIAVFAASQLQSFVADRAAKLAAQP